MKRSVSTLGCALFLTILSFFPTEAQNLSAGARRNVLFTDLMNGMPISRPPSGIQGDPYVSGWRLTSLKLYDYEEMIEGYYMRYNIYFDELEFKTQKGIRAIEASKVQSFVMKDSAEVKFVNGKEYQLDGIPLTGLLLVLQDGPAQAFRKYAIDVKAPDYHPALNAGSRDTRLKKRSELLYAKDGQIFVFKNKKKMMPFFGDKSEKIEQFIKNNKIFLSDERSLIAVIQYYNTLLE